MFLCYFNSNSRLHPNPSERQNPVVSTKFKYVFENTHLETVAFFRVKPGSSIKVDLPAAIGPMRVQYSLTVGTDRTG